MSTTEVGIRLKGSEERDAIHIAVAPMRATETLVPGQRVGFLREEDFVSASSQPYQGEFLGIVDPFLTGSILKDERFWLFIFPGKAQALRHSWEHPSFGMSAADKSAALSRAGVDPCCPDEEYLWEQSSRENGEE